MFFSIPDISRDDDDDAGRSDDHGRFRDGNLFPGEGDLQRGGYRNWTAGCGGVTSACPLRGERASRWPQQSLRVGTRTGPGG